MRRIWLALAAAIVLGVLSVPARADSPVRPSSSASGAAAPALRAVCGSLTSHYRCLSLVRTYAVVAAAAATHDGFGPADLASAYKLASTSGGGQTVAVVDAYDDPNAEADMNVYRAYYHLPPCTTANGCFRKVNQSGDPAPLPRPDPDWAIEESLDLDMVSAVCPLCHILFVEANSADETTTQHDVHADLGESVDTAVRLGATEVSNSYGSVGPEPDERTLDHYYNHPGVAITVSSGDFGYEVDYPASSPYVVSIGGTSLTKATTARGWTETVWGSGVLSQVPEIGGGAGSGCSAYEAKPTWQTDKGCAQRTVSDVSAVADPNTGVAVYDSYIGGGGWLVVGGTSVSSPLMAAVFALAGGGHGVAYPAKTLYAHPTNFFDITSGSNASAPTIEGCDYLCTGVAGYDGPTGLGTPNGVRGLQP